MQNALIEKIYDMAKDGVPFDKVSDEIEGVQINFELDLKEIPEAMRKVLNASSKIIKDHPFEIERKWQMDEKIKFIAQKYFEEFPEENIENRD